MGRRPDPPGLQAAKGNPGKRKKARPLKTADRVDIVARFAGSIIPPEFLTEPMLADALALWSENAGLLKKQGLVTDLDRYVLARWCVHTAEWINAVRILGTDPKKGFYRSKSYSGGGDYVERPRGVLKMRELAEKHLPDLEARLGIGAGERYRLLRDQAAMPGGLFDAPPQKASAAESDEPDGAIGALARHGQGGPGERLQ